MIDVAKPLHSIDMVERYIEQHATAVTIVAVDAPLIISNASGQRECERLVSVRYGARHGSCHTTNITRYPDADSVRLATHLKERGFTHVAASSERILLEVYPHAALLTLFRLPRILKYKKGPVGKRCQGLTELQDHLRCLTKREPRLILSSTFDSLMSISASSLRGTARKSFEDSLDSVVCAYIAFHHWYWRGEKTDIFGDVTKGYIAVPMEECA